MIRGRTLYHPNGKTAATISYDYDGELLARTDYLYDARGRVTQVTEQIDDGQTPDTAVTGYAYSDAGFSVGGQLYHIRITDGEGKLTYIALDSFGNRTKTLYPSGDYQEYRYNADGQMTAKAVWDASGVKQWIAYSYDPYGRVDRVDYPDSGFVEYAYDGFGRRTQVTDTRNTDDRIGGSNTITWEHDALGRVTKVTDQDGWQVVYSWRGDGQRSAIRVIEPDDLATMYHAAYLYDKAGRLEFVAEPLRGSTTPWVAKLAYDDNGNRDGLTYYLDGTFGGDTVALGYDYNADNRLTGFSTTGGPTFALANTTVDGLGRLRAGTETLTLVGGGTRSHVLSYGYDMRSQLTGASVSNINGSTWTAGYTYDKAGNVTQQTVGGNETDFDYDGDLMTAKGGQTLDWDADGRMISGLSRSLTYNWDSKLRSATAGGNTVALRYDPDGNRVLRTVNSTTSRKYVVDTVAELPTILLEIDPSVQDPNQAITKTYIYANSQIIAQHDGYFGDGLYFYLHDRLGSVREVINTSAAVVNSYTYEPFGQSFPTEVTQTIANPWQFTGQYFDAEFGQYFLRARQYDPAIYRFTARDPYQGSFQEPMELHRYLYCLNDPIDATDPSGEVLLDLLLGQGLSARMRVASAAIGAKAMAFAGRLYAAAYVRMAFTNLFIAQAMYGGGDGLIKVSRWGRQGLSAGDWIMKGGANWINYILSGKWQPKWMPGNNMPAAKNIGEEFLIYVTPSPLSRPNFPLDKVEVVPVFYPQSPP